MGPANQPPSTLGRYAVRRRIGSGGFATVWLAYDEQLDSPVAVKVLGDIWTEDLEIRRRFVEEGRFLRRVESPYVVSVYDAGELDDGRPYLVMSYADQGTLADRLEAGGLTPAQTLDVVRQVGAGLQALHDRGVLHRDVKPANVLFRSVSGSLEIRAMLGDLGLGKTLDASSRLTMIAGTPSFIAPEQAAAESPGPAADQYSLGALTYLLLTGRRPFERDTIKDATAPMAREPVSTPERPFPEAVEVVLGRALSFSPTDRYPTVTDFTTALEAALASATASEVSVAAPTSVLSVDTARTQPGSRPSSITVPGVEAASPTDPPPQSRPRRRSLWLGAALAVVALAVGGTAGYVAQRSRHREVLVYSDAGTLGVTVPTGWDGARATDGWRPPGAEADYDAVSVGTSADWTDVTGPGEGVFVGLLPGSSLPDRLPQHPECRSREPVTHVGSGVGASVTAVYQDCPDGVTVERVVQVTDDQLVWVQIRSTSQATADDVLGRVFLRRS